MTRTRNWYHTTWIAGGCMFYALTPGHGSPYVTPYVPSLKLLWSTEIVSLCVLFGSSIQQELGLQTPKYEAADNLDRSTRIGSCFYFWLHRSDVFLMMLCCPTPITQLMHACKPALYMLLVILMNSVSQLTWCASLSLLKIICASLSVSCFKSYLSSFIYIIILYTGIFFYNYRRVINWLSTETSFFIDIFVMFICMQLINSSSVVCCNHAWFWRV